MSLDVYLECPCCNSTLYSDNVTHNLVGMAEFAGIYQACWRPKEIEAKKANDIIGKLQDGLDKLVNNEQEAKTFNPENGWGNYDIFVEFVHNYLKACTENPEAIIRVSR